MRKMLSSIRYEYEYIDHYRNKSFERSRTMVDPSDESFRIPNDWMVWYGISISSIIIANVCRYTETRWTHIHILFLNFQLMRLYSRCIVNVRCAHIAHKPKSIVGMTHTHTRGIMHPDEYCRLFFSHFATNANHTMNVSLLFFVCVSFCSFD